MNTADPLRCPRSLAEVARWSESFSDFSYHLHDFLHYFQDNPSAAALAEDPPPLESRFPDGRIAGAYLAAAAAALADSRGLVRPRWTAHASRFLEAPWFASPSRHLRATLLLESPAAFRERNLFVSSNALSVA